MLKTIISVLVIHSFLLFQDNKSGIIWNTMSHDFGTIIKGEKVSTEFKYYNHSDSNFIIENVVGSCGCVIGTWSKKPLAPGDSGVIKVTFNSEGKNKRHEKVVTVYSSHGLFDLVIIANILKP